ncbi:hypothetical protein Pmar_PMAR003647 [Perkinsus marinus ATCC 50983]|uniref:Uncharacterized protein n=1 Tax=Perkinsus marinus (strain ATCC 50983 / TXsc) TaxID=423536 RepID=C5KHX2_PERM5|nr:hypothetical protein Pmar_PMAR003647 [Perkinsus marinus ATCC 50983]EER16184.1 hypothetical protein Pmar_PMAR003647 [Perkinsus marinus ATCC 50983]|eukprot:XP_002784388.1 hypothetical protein Pmar_PMAR003647 [Perkinsus marinus ATCC 50983]
MTNGPAYPFPYYTVTIGRKEEAIDSTQVQGEEEGDDASTTSGSCDDRRPGLCKHAALVARLLLLPTSDPQPPRVGVCVRRRTLVDDEEKETSPEGGYKTSESAARLSTAASAVEER